MQNSKKGFFLAAIVFLSAVYTLISIIAAKTGLLRSSFFYSGFFLYSYYLDSAFYVPAYLFACAFFIVRSAFHYHHVIILILTLIPFVTAGAGLRLLNPGNVPGGFEKILLDSFGNFAPFVVFLVVLIEIMGIVKAALFLAYRRKIKTSAGSDGGAGSPEVFTDRKGAIAEADISFTGEGAAKGPTVLSGDMPEFREFREFPDEDSAPVTEEKDISPAGKGFHPLKFSSLKTAGKGETPLKGISAEEAISENHAAGVPDEDEYDEPAVYRAMRERAGSAPERVRREHSTGSSMPAPPGLKTEEPGQEKTDSASDSESDIYGGVFESVSDGEDEADDFLSEEEELIASGEKPFQGTPVPAPLDTGIRDPLGPESPDEAVFADEAAGDVEEEPEETELNIFDENISDEMFGKKEKPVVVKEYFAAQRKINVKKKEYKISFDILDQYEETGFSAIDERTKDEAEILRKTLAEFRIEAEVTGIRKGPVITMFEILPAPGVKLSRITNLADNIALRLAASRVRIVAPIPGKHAVGIEVPNRHRAIVSFRELIAEDYPQYSKYHLPIILGKDITGGEQIIDLTQTPHLLIAGATGSGKSVCVNSIIASLLYTRKPQDVRLILVDPKIVELKLYNDIPHLLTPVITDPKKAFQALQYCIYEMEKRYALLDALGVRDIHSFNKKIKNKNIATLPLPYIVVIVDEFADLMATTGKELESTLARLAAMSRAVGIHLVLATQRPSIDVITGLIKANIPSRIAFMVASKTDSRIIIDSVGAEMLLGRGDMLFTSAWNPYLTRIQGAYLSESEAERVAEKVREYGAPEYIDDEIFIDDDEDDGYGSYDESYGEDPLMDKALEIVSAAGKASASYLQRRLKIGYNRAARLVEEMERRGIVGPQNGSKPRDILNIPGSFRE